MCVYFYFVVFCLCTFRKNSEYLLIYSQLFVVFHVFLAICLVSFISRTSVQLQRVHMGTNTTVYLFMLCIPHLSLQTQTPQWWFAGGQPTKSTFDRITSFHIRQLSLLAIVFPSAWLLNSPPQTRVRQVMREFPDDRSFLGWLHDLSVAGGQARLKAFSKLFRIPWFTRSAQRAAKLGFGKTLTGCIKFSETVCVPVLLLQQTLLGEQNWAEYWKRTSHVRHDVQDATKTHANGWTPQRGRAVPCYPFCEAQLPRALRTCQFLIALTSDRPGATARCTFCWHLGQPILRTTSLFGPNVWSLRSNETKSKVLSCTARGLETCPSSLSPLIPRKIRFGLGMVTWHAGAISPTNSTPGLLRILHYLLVCATFAISEDV